MFAGGLELSNVNRFGFEAKGLGVFEESPSSDRLAHSLLLRSRISCLSDTYPRRCTTAINLFPAVDT